MTEEQMAQFKPSHLRGICKPVKRSINVRIDADILEWLKSAGIGYQTRINAVLREAMMKADAAN
ncbi:MAG: BrnA antitoxin family protein [Dysgonamonadaceae bacterium]|nr:BrnA antitoxin family protein [Dysgonamonadaceae bacterium]